MVSSNDFLNFTHNQHLATRENIDRVNSHLGEQNELTTFPRIIRQKRRKHNWTTSYLANYMLSQDIPMLVYARLYTATVALGYGYLFCNMIALQLATFRNILTFQRLHAQNGVNLQLKSLCLKPQPWQHSCARSSACLARLLISSQPTATDSYTTATWDAISRLLSKIPKKNPDD